jgi:peroxiredoxin
MITSQLKTSVQLSSILLLVVGLFLSSCSNSTTTTPTTNNNTNNGTDWSTNTNPVGLVVGNQAPDFTLSTPAGSSLSLKSLRGKITMVYFWGSWCPICQGRSSIVKGVYSKYNAQGFTIYGVAVSDEESSWKEYINSKQLSWNHGFDGSANIQRLYSENGNPPGMSSYYILDKRGTILAKGSATDISNGTLDTQVANALK